MHAMDFKGWLTWWHARWILDLYQAFPVSLFVTGVGSVVQRLISSLLSLFIYHRCWQWHTLGEFLASHACTDQEMLLKVNFAKLRVRRHHRAS